MPKKEKGKFQSWNSASKKWILFQDGKIKQHSAEKFEGVPVEKDKPEETPAPSPKEEVIQVEVEEPIIENQPVEDEPEENPFWIW